MIQSFISGSLTTMMNTVTTTTKITPMMIVAANAISISFLVQPKRQFLTFLVPTIPSGEELAHCTQDNGHSYEQLFAK